MESLTHLVRELADAGYLRAPRVIDAFRKIDRSDFLPQELRSEAYINEPLPIGYGQTISQPLTVAFMLELLQPEEGQKILDVGSGSGWQTALLAHIVGPKGKVFGIERVPELKSIGEKNISKYNFIKKGIAKVIRADGSKGLKDQAPFDRIIAAAMAMEIPEALKKQLKIGGRLVMPKDGSVWLLVKESENKFKEYEYPGFSFVPLITE